MAEPWELFKSSDTATVEPKPWESFSASSTESLPDELPPWEQIKKQANKPLFNPPGGDLRSEANPQTPWSMFKEAVSYGAEETNKLMRDKSKEGLNILTNFIPDFQHALFNVPKAALEVAGETSADILDPKNVAVLAAEPVIAGIKKIPAVAEGIQKAAPTFAKLAEEYAPTLKRWFTYRSGQPEAYQRAAEQRTIDIQKGIDKAVEVGKSLSEDFSPAEQQRIAQIIRGGVSTADSAQVFRERAGVARAAMDGLEKEAKDLGILPEQAFGELSDNQLADLRNKKAAIDKTITKISRYGAFQQKEALLSKAAKVDVVGGEGIASQVAKAQEQNYQGVKGTIEAGKNAGDALVGKMQNFKTALSDAKEHLSGEEFKTFEDLLQMEQLRRSKGLQRTLQRYEKLSIAEQEHVFNRLSGLLDKLKGDNAAQDVVQTAQAGATAVSKTLGGIDTDKLSVSNLKGLIKQIEDVSGRFPGQKALVRSLSEKSLTLQKEIADSYRVAGQSYMPRLYAAHELEARVPGFAVGRTGKMVLDRLRARKDIPDDMKRAMGEIMEAGYPTAKGLAQMSQAVNTFRLFRKVAENPEWSTASASEAAAKGFQQVANSRGYGDLAGKFIHPEIHRDIQGITKAPGDIEKLYSSILAKWKYGKVILNPATHFRNMLQNTVMMDLGGVDPIAQTVLLPRAAKELATKGKYYQEAYDLGLMGNTFYGKEIASMRDELLKGKGPIISRVAQYSDALANGLERAGTTAAKAADKLGQIYQGEEKVWKLAKFIHSRETGLSAEEAATDANKWLFDYGKVSPAIQFIRKIPGGSPFITYTSKALPRIAEAAATQPMKIWKYEMLFEAMRNKALEKGIVTQEEADTIHRTAPNRVAILPAKDENGDPLTLDVSYLLPWGDIADTGGVWGLPPVASPSGPLMAVVDLLKNNSTFKQSATGEGRIWMDTDLPGEKLRKGTDYAVKAFLPSLFPGGIKEDSFIKGGYSWEKLVTAAEKRPDYFGRIRNPMLAALDVIMGLRISPVDPAQKAGFEALKKVKQSNEARDQAAKILRSQGYSEKYKAKTVDNYVKKIQNIWGK